MIHNQDNSNSLETGNANFSSSNDDKGEGNFSVSSGDSNFDLQANPLLLRPASAQNLPVIPTLNTSPIVLTSPIIDNIEENEADRQTAFLNQKVGEIVGQPDFNQEIHLLEANSALDITSALQDQPPPPPNEESHQNSMEMTKKQHETTTQNKDSQCFYDENGELKTISLPVKPMSQIPMPKLKAVSSYGTPKGKNEIELTEERSKWLHQILVENPHFLAMRERSLPLSGGYSFANVTHTLTVSALSALNRRSLLELISQHLQSIGMYKTAEVISSESGHTFQDSGQPWDRTDLHLLVSLALGNREDPWNLPADMSHKFAIEALEEDFFSSTYREDPETIWDEYFNPDLNVIYEEGKPHNYQNIKAASLKRLIVYHVTSDQQMIPNEEQEKFFLTIHSITSSEHFLRHLVTLFECDLSNNPKYEQIKDEDFYSIRLNIINLIRKWTFFHGLFIGRRTLKGILQFFNRVSSSPTFVQFQKFTDNVIQKVKELRYGMIMGSQVMNDRKPPLITDEHIIFHPSLTILQPEPLEVARQITLIYHEKYASIHSLEFIIAISNRHSTFQTPTLNEFFDFGDHLSHLIAETFINAEKKPEAYSRLLEIARSLVILNNFEALSCFVHLLRRDDFMKLGKVTEMQKDELLEMWKDSGEDIKDEKVHPTSYEKFISKVFHKWDSGIPNMHAEIKRGDKDMRKKPDFINGLINWEKVKEVARICHVLYRFQNQSYNLWAIPQIAKAIMRPPLLSIDELESKIDELCKLI